MLLRLLLPQPVVMRANSGVAVTASVSLCVVEHDVVSGGSVSPRVSSVSMWEQLSVAAFLQKYWADNQVWHHGSVCSPRSRCYGSFSTPCMHSHVCDCV